MRGKMVKPSGCACWGHCTHFLLGASTPKIPSEAARQTTIAKDLANQALHRSLSPTGYSTDHSDDGDGRCRRAVRAARAPERNAHPLNGRQRKCLLPQNRMPARKHSDLQGVGVSFRRVQQDLVGFVWRKDVSDSRTRSRHRRRILRVLAHTARHKIRQPPPCCCWSPGRRGWWGAPARQKEQTNTARNALALFELMV